MTTENTDLERRVLAHEQILQPLVAQLAQSQPNFLDQLQGRFGAVRRGAYEHDYVETADYAEAFLHEVARLVRAGVNRPAAVDVAAGGASAEPVRAVMYESVIIHSARLRGVWHVTRNGSSWATISPSPPHARPQKASPATWSGAGPEPRCCSDRIHSRRSVLSAA